MPIVIAGGGGAGGGGELTYNEITANVTIVANTEGTANTVVTATAFTFPGSAVIAEFFTSRADCQSTLGAALVILLQEGAAILGRLALITNPAAAAFAIPVYARYRFTPTAASHTYTVTAFCSPGAATIEAGSGGSGQQLPSFLRFSKV